MQSLFQMGNLLAMVGWLALVVSLFWRGGRGPIQLFTGLIAPTIFAVVYVWLMVAHWGGAQGGGFSSITQVRALFAYDPTLVAGWVHYLAFDLFVGTWIAREGLKSGVWSVLLIPCLLLTFMFGPAGLLLFLALRLAFKGKELTA